MTIQRVAEGAALRVDSVEATGRCRSCESEVVPEDGFWICEGCGSVDIETTGGKELILASITVED